MKQQVFDVVVVGSGAGGLCAAIAARLSGLSAVVLEKEALWGGATAVSGGAVWVPDNHVARRAGAQDSIDSARTYLQALCGDRFDAALVERYLDAGPRVVEFLESRTAVRFTSPEAYPDYQSELDGAGSRRVLRPERFDGRLLGPWFETLRWPLRETMLYGRVSIAPEDVPHLLGMTTSVRSAAYVSRLLLRYAADRMAGAPRGMKLANGNALAARLGKSAFDLGIALWLESPVRRLLVEQGRVVGVVVERTGTSVELRARRGVVLATGGFANDPGYRRRFHAHVARGCAHYTLVPPGSTGDGLRFGVEAGGDEGASARNAAVWMPVSLLRDRAGTCRPVAHLLDRLKPGFIAVDAAGRRFGNESASYQEFVPALLGAAAASGTPDAYAFLIADHRAVRRYGMGAQYPAPAPLGAHLRSGYLKSGATLVELAEKTGLDAAALVATVARFNAYAKSGVDPEFGRGETAYQRFMGDPGNLPNPCLGPLDTPPFYAVKIFPGDVATCHGLRIDADARVIDSSGEAIDGLYGAGNDAASIFAGAYPGAGCTLGPAIVFGTLAGMHLAGRQAALRGSQ